MAGENGADVDEVYGHPPKPKPTPFPTLLPMGSQRYYPVDPFSGQAFDPSKNVLDALFAAVTRVNDLTNAYLQRQDDLRGALDKRVTELNEQRNSFDIRLGSQRDAYDNRIENLKSQHQIQMHASESDFGKQIAQILAQQTEKNANLLATALAAVTERLAVVEKNQYVTGGQTAVRDPVVTQAIEQLNRSIEAINNSLTTLSRSTSTTRDVDSGSRSGQVQQVDATNRLVIIMIGIGAIVAPTILHFVK
jgi:hypothetical protein